MALVGCDNVFVTELKYLETNRFETAHIAGKRLVLITDSERYGGPVSVLKALTGQDAIRWEQKYHKHQRSFTAEAMVMVAANEPIQSSDYTSGLERRRLTVPFRHRPNASKRLLEFARGEPGGLFAPYLAGVMNWVLAMPEVEMTRLLVRTREAVPSMQQSWTQTLLDTNPLAEWANTSLIHEPKARTNVGVVKKSDYSHSYQYEDVWLYPNYHAYTEATGHKPVSQRRFSGLLEDLCQSQLRLEGVAHGRDVQGAHFTGLRLRQHHETAALLITEAYAPPLTEAGAGDGSDGSLTAKTRADDGSDGSDGYLESSQDKAAHTVGADEKRQQAPAEYKETIEHPSDPSDPSFVRLSAVSEASASRHQPETAPPPFDTPTTSRRCPHCGGGRLQVRVASVLCEACGYKITS
jgi:putative DNA primase/helicase